MNSALLPLDIIVHHIAGVRPGALWVCLRLCKSIYAAIAPDLEHLQAAWVRHVSTMRVYHSTHVVYVIFTRWVNPSGTYHGPMEIATKYMPNSIITRFSGNFKNGVPHGKFVKYRPYGDPQIANYVDGVLHGECTDISSGNGTVITTEINYAHGVKCGKHTEFVNGVLAHQCVYDTRDATCCMSIRLPKITYEKTYPGRHGWHYASTKFGRKIILYYRGRRILKIKASFAHELRALIDDSGEIGLVVI